MTEVRSLAFAPATVANLACGFDVLGLALESPGDTVSVARSEKPGLRIESIEGDGGRLSKDPEENTATVAIRKLLERRRNAASIGLSIAIRKGLPLASGMGSSAASAAAAAMAASDLLGLGASSAELLEAVLEGERIVAGSGHPDNAAACLYGGIVLVRSPDPLDLVRLPFPDGLSMAILRPHLEMSTRDSRVLLGNEIRLKDAVQQWGNLGGLVAGLYTRDLELVSRSLEDRIAEPIRSKYVPGFSAVKEAAIGGGALGASLSGSGPSLFALCPNLETAESVSRKMAEAFRGTTDLGFELYVSRVGSKGARIVKGEESP